MPLAKQYDNDSFDREKVVYNDVVIFGNVTIIVDNVILIVYNFTMIVCIHIMSQ